MADTDLQHTVQKYTQLTEQSFMYNFEQIAKNKNFVNSGTFKSQLKSTANDIYNGAKNSGLDDIDSLKELKNAQSKMIDAYLDEYKQLLANNNKSTAEDASITIGTVGTGATPAVTATGQGITVNENGITGLTTGGSSIDIDPEVRYETEYQLSTYGAFYNGKKIGKNVSAYAATNNTYSMCDMVCQINVPTNTGQYVTATLGKLQTLSYSIFQNKTPVRVIGNMNARDYVYGQRTIAGSLIFAVFNTHWLVDIYNTLHDTDGMKNWHFIADEIPPFDITISFANEYGYDSRMAIYGVRLVNEGQTMSINDIYIENTYEYVATDIEILDSLKNWQTSNKIGRRYNIAGSISSSGNKATNTNDPKMFGKNEDSSRDSNNTNTSTINFLVPEPLVDTSEKNLKNSSEEEMARLLSEAKDKVSDKLEEARTKLKEGKTPQEQEEVEKQWEDAHFKLSEVFSKDWDTIKSYYAKKKKDQKVEND